MEGHEKAGCGGAQRGRARALARTAFEPLGSEACNRRSNNMRPLLRLLSGLGLLLVAQAAALTPEAEADYVDWLPTFGDLANATFPVTMYSGYLPVNKMPSREIFYTFVESEGDPEQDPLILWLQGGPGCSSLGLGFFQEIGPFSFAVARNVSNPVLLRNGFSWSKFASVLFLDTPAFTGFSRSSDNATARYWGDSNTTADNILALREFFNRFPDMLDRPLFLAGQGYAGHFVPLLAQSILEYNAQPELPDPIPLKGIMVGNPWTDPLLDNGGAIAYWYSQGIISRSTWVGLKNNCSAADIVLWMTEGTHAGNVTGACAESRDAMLKETAALNLFGLNAPKCYMEPGFVPPGDDGILPLEGDLASVQSDLGPQPFQPPVASRPGGSPNPYFDPCISFRAAAYLSNPEVQEALHAIGIDEPAVPWRACNPDAFTYSLPDMLTSMVPAYKTLIANFSLPIMIYSGDTDSVFPTVATRTWVEPVMEQLGRPALQFGSYVDQVGEIMGFRQEYDGLTFVTVMDAGHSVPWYKPGRTQYFFQKFVEESVAAAAAAEGGGGAAPAPQASPVVPEAGAPATAP